MPFKLRDIDETQQPLLEHLVELRGRLVKCVIALALAFVVCLYFASDIFSILVWPLAGAFPEGVEIHRQGLADTVTACRAFLAPRAKDEVA